MSKTDFYNRDSIDKLKGMVASQKRETNKFIKKMESNVNEISNTSINKHTAKGFWKGSLHATLRAIRAVPHGIVFLGRKFSRLFQENDKLDILNSDSYYNNTNSYQVVDKLATNINVARDNLAKYHNQLDSKLTELKNSAHGPVKIVGKSNLYQQNSKSQQTSASSGYVTAPIMEHQF